MQKWKISEQMSQMNLARPNLTCQCVFVYVCVCVCVCVCVFVFILFHRKGFFRL